MKNLDPYIGELLFEHDCVIVTDLGGFLASPSPANTNHALQVIYPPSKRIAFNASLKTNDGLLANHIAARNGITYNAACEFIRNYVTAAFESFEKGKKLQIDKVGTLFLDAQKKIQFQPNIHSNFLTASFGLGPVHAPLIQEEKPAPAYHAPVRKQRTITPAKVKAPSKKRKPGVLEMIPAAAVLAFILITPPVLQRLNTELSGLLPFSRINEYYMKWTGMAPEKRELQLVLPSPFIVPPPVETVTHVAVPDTTAVAPGWNFETPLQDENTGEPKTIRLTSAVFDVVAAKPAAQGYHIIGGCFRSMENANKFIDTLQQKGIEATVIGKSAAGLHMVSMFHTTNLAAAEQRISTGFEGVNGAWIYTR